MAGISSTTEPIAGRVHTADAERIKRMAKSQRTTVSLTLKRLVHDALRDLPA